MSRPAILRVGWFDMRAVAQREAMDVEMSALYADSMAGMSPELQATVDDALTVDAATILTSVIALHGATTVGHAALRPVETGEHRGALEVKKVFVEPSYRGAGVSRLLMTELEAIARERGVNVLVLQTGNLQLAAIGLYLRLGYELIEPFGKYTALSVALCYRKVLAA